MDRPAAHESEHQPAGEGSVVGVGLYRRTNGDDRLYVTFSNSALKHALDGMAREDQPFTCQNANPSACPGSIFSAFGMGATIKDITRLLFSENSCASASSAPQAAGGASIPFEPDELEAKLQTVLEISEADRAALEQRAMDRVRERYSWEAVTDAYEKLLRELR